MGVQDTNRRRSLPKEKMIDPELLKAELNQIITESLTELGGSDVAYTELLAFLNENNMLSRPRRLLVGQLIFFKYAPQDQRFLESNRPFDAYPLIFITTAYRGGFEGINLHYLDPETRSLLFENMRKSFTTLGKPNRTARININYHDLRTKRSLRSFKACYRNYKWDGIRKPPISVPFQFWETLIHQDLGFFGKKNKSNIYLESWATIRKPTRRKSK